MLTERQAAEVGFKFPNPAPSMPQMQHAPMQSDGHGTDLPCHLSMPSAVTKPCCALFRCNRVAAAECGLCKSCCEGRGRGCSSSKHRSGPPRQKVINTFTPSRPPTVSPSLPTVASTSAVSSFNFQHSTPLESVFTADSPNPFSHITRTIRSSGHVLLAYNTCQRILADGHVYNVSASPLVY